MKKLRIIFLWTFIIMLAVLSFGCISQKEGGRYALNGQNIGCNEEYLRIHIRADSNEIEAQAVKYKVRDEVVKYLTPVVAECETKEEAERKLKAKLTEIEKISDGVLRSSGFSYRAKAELCEEEFPTRVYGEYTLSAGRYSALIIRLGKGAGDNWWCVVYPPLCFAATSGNVVYKSKIREIIENWSVHRRDRE